METPLNRRPSSGRPSGIALLVVMLLGAIIIPFVAEFAYQISIESIMASNVTDQLAIDNAIESQYQIVLARLQYDGPGNETDSYDDPWNDDQILQRTDEDSGVNLATTIFDEQGKLNVNMLAEASADRRAVWKARFVDLVKRFRNDTKFDASPYAEEVAEAISRWVTGQTNRGAIPKPKTQDDRAMLVLEELNFASDLFQKHHLLTDIREGENVAPGLQRYITVYGTGKVNLNTADKFVLQAIFNADPDIADRIIERRQGGGEDDATSDTDPLDSSSGGEGDAASGNPFTDPNQVMEVEGVNQGLLLRNKVVPAEDFSVKTQFFSVRIAAQRENSRREELYVVQRVPGTDPNGEIEGFRHLLCQERSDPLEELPEDDQ